MPIRLEFARLAKRFHHSRSGAVAVIYALMTLPITGLVGATVDYSSALTAKTELDSYADSAALLGAGQNLISDSTSTVKTRTTNAFNAMKGNVKNDVKVTSTTVTVTDSGTTRTVVVKYSAKRTTSFVSLLGVSEMTFSGSATAQTTLATYIDFHLLLDNTPSMAVGATTSDISRLESKFNCAFACHIEGSSTDSYSWAKANNVTLRIDLVRQATQSLMDTAKSSQIKTGQYRVALHTFGDSCKKLGLKTLTSLTSDLTAAKTTAEQIDTMTIPYQGYNSDQCTDFVGTLEAVNKVIANPGAGTSSSTPQKVLYFVADGVNDGVVSSYGCSKVIIDTTRCQEPINTTWCTTIKARGIKIAVLYTTYVPITNDEHYNRYIAPFQSEIPTKMKECASPGLYFEVTPSQGITEAMNTLFQQAVASAKLVQ